MPTLSVPLPPYSQPVHTNTGGSTLGGHRVTLQIRARRFWCCRAHCRRRIFCERLPSLAPLTDAEPLPFATRWNRSALPLVAGQASVLLPAWVFQSVA
jgi:hypothetical protein